MRQTTKSIIILIILTICLTFSTQAQNDSTGDRWQDSGNNVLAPLPNTGVLRVENATTRYVEIGPKNGSWCHFLTNAPRNYFNKEIRVNTGRIGSYDENLFLRTGTATRMTLLLSNGNVGIGTTTPTKKLDVAGDGQFTKIVADGDAALCVNFSNPASTLGGDITRGIQIQSTPFLTKGTQIGLQVETATDAANSYHKGRAEGRLATSGAFSAAGTFIGATGYSLTQNLNATTSYTSHALGGQFVGGADGTTPLNLNGGWYKVGGVQGILTGEINGTTSNGAIAAIIGEDNNTGTAESYAGLFKGKGCFTDLVKIGDVTTPVGYKLYVEDGILTERIQVAPKNSILWADYVFAEDYELKTVEEVAAFVKENKHLPNIPSAQEINEQGFDLGQMDAKLLEKIEELTLYVIQLNEANEQLQKRISDLEQ